MEVFMHFLLLSGFYTYLLDREIIMKYYNNLHWEVLRGLNVGRLTLPNKIEANVLRLSHSYKVVISHPLAKEQTFDSEHQVDEYLQVMSKLGEYNV